MQKHLGTCDSPLQPGICCLFNSHIDPILNFNMALKTEPIETFYLCFICNVRNMLITISLHVSVCVLMHFDVICSSILLIIFIFQSLSNQQPIVIIQHLIASYNPFSCSNATKKFPSYLMHVNFLETRVTICTLANIPWIHTHKTKLVLAFKQQTQHWSTLLLDKPSLDHHHGLFKANFKPFALKNLLQFYELILTLLIHTHH